MGRRVMQNDRFDPSRLSVALARGNGCTCPLPETITETIDGITHVTVLHDDDCPLLARIDLDTN